MIDLSMFDDTVVAIGEKYTFAGVLKEFFGEICETNYWRSEEHTQKPYLNDYMKRIIPLIDDHDSKTIDEYTYEDYRQVIQKLEDQSYSPERIVHFMRLIDAVTSMAHTKLGVVNVLWGTIFELPEIIDADEKIKELLKLKKSLTVKQEIAIYRLLTEKVDMDGEYFGVYLMLIAGLRDGEACGVDYADLKQSYGEEDFHVLLVYKTVESKEHRLVSSGKTKNADRIIPIPDPVYNFLMKRKKHIAEKLCLGEEELDAYP
ncbi:MAG: hypothetical protein K6E18_05395, partial [Lachnospiraceae bacterium]|nr:hypothetical protein [Lachnospiraceae bacterium]